MSGGAPLPASQMPLQKVHEVQFEVFKEQQIKDYAVCMVEQPKSFENGVAVRGGINDLRMGTTDFESCETCHMRHPECPGHFGYMELAEPLFNIGVFDVVILTLKCVCKECGALLIDSTKIKEISALSGLNRLRLCAKYSNTKTCRVGKGTDPNEPDKGCQATQPRVGRFQELYPGLKVRAEFENQAEEWYADKVLEIFRRISDSDARIMGFKPEYCHPKDLILTVLPIPPPQVRPAISFGSMKSDDELTHQIMSILKQNIRLRSAKESNSRADVESARALLQEHVACFFNNASTFYKPNKVSDMKRLKSVTERLKGKHGRLRGNLMGKRVDFSARTVITGDPNIDVDEVGVPFSVAMTLTFPERVNTINKKRLTEFVRRGTYPSANYIIHSNDTITKLGLVRDRTKINLNVGDIVERHVINGDVVLFNRQPTLHRMSMMGHRVRVLNYNTFRLNLSCTTPYNADFDGDEMNLHVPQSLLTKAELIEMMMVPKNFVSPNKSAPCMGIVQDSLLGCYRLTDKDTFLDKYFIQSVAVWLDRWELPVPAILKPRPLWTGKQIFSLILPEVSHPSNPYKTPIFPVADDKVMIQRGQLLVGAIKKNIVGASPGSLIHVIFNERGSDEVAKFINGVQRITTFFLYNFSFSVGIQDAVADAQTLVEIDEVLKKGVQAVKKTTQEALGGHLTRKAGMSYLKSFEVELNKALNACRDDAGKKILENIKRTNSFKVMFDAGSKGSDHNICQISAFVGQQNVAGERIPFGFRRRTLPHFMLDDFGDISRGMVTHGYVEGLQPYEFYFHTMAGREGLIDTAVKTADTGYLQRKLIKALEDVHAAYDGTVRNASQELIQFIYGEDGLDGARIERIDEKEFTLPLMSDADMAKSYKFEFNEDGSLSNNAALNYIDPAIRRLLVKDSLNAIILNDEYNQLGKDREFLRSLMDVSTKRYELNIPVNIGRLLQNARSTMGMRSQVSNLNPITVIEKLNKLQSDLAQLFPGYHKGLGGGFTNVLNKERVDNALKLFRIYLRQTLAAKRVLKEYKLTEKAFEHLIKEIRTKYQQSLISAGEIVGSIAAQSCGEPATQMTLNTFHNAGISSKNVTLGVPRLLELLNVSKNQKNSSVLIHLIKRMQDQGNAFRAAHMIEYCTLASLTTTVQVIYDPDPRSTVVKEDQEIVQLVDDVNAQGSEQASPFVVRIILDSQLLDDKRLSVTFIMGAMRAEDVDDKYDIIGHMRSTSDSARVIRVREKRCSQANGRDAIPNLVKGVTDLLANVHLVGIPGIKRALMTKVEMHEIDPQTQGVVDKKVSVHYVDTEGTAMKKIFVGVLDKKDENIIDFHKTCSNKIPEVNQVLGIEAARRKLHQEMEAVYTSYSLKINYRHYTVLVDTMCQRGYLMAVSRTGINRSEMSGPLMRCSFEETVKILMDAATFGERDPVRGVSANIILGNQPRVGTGLFDVMLNMSALSQAVPQEEAIAPGKQANIYHSMNSVLEPSMVGYGGGARHTATEATPLVNAPSALYRTAGASLSSVPSAAYDTGALASTLFGGGLRDASMVHYSQAYPSAAYQPAQPSASYSAMSSASVYRPMSSYAPSQSGSEAYVEASSFHIASSAAPPAPVYSSSQYSHAQLGDGGSAVQHSEGPSASHRGGDGTESARRYNDEEGGSVVYEHDDSPSNEFVANEEEEEYSRD